MMVIFARLIVTLYCNTLRVFMGSHGFIWSCPRGKKLLTEALEHVDTVGVRGSKPLPRTIPQSFSIKAMLLGPRFRRALINRRWST